MNKEKQKLVPELRFPKFKNDGDWKEVPLIGVTDKNVKWSFTGGPFGSNLKSSDYVVEENGIRVIQLQNIGDGEFKNDYKIFTSKEKADELLSCNIYPGDIIMSKMGDPVGRACLIPDFHDRYVMGSDGIRIVVDENKYDKYFIYLIINSKIFRSKVESSSTGSTRKRIGLIDLKKLTLFVPKDKVEQQRIANCLSSLDNLIKVETDKLAKIKDHKKGLLQQLYPREGKTQPQYRFPEFKNDGAWIETTLDEVADYQNGKAHEQEISESGKYKVVNSKFISTEGKTVKYSHSANLKANVGDILMVLSDIPNGRAIAKCFYVDKDDAYTVNQRICKITPTNIDNKFLFYIQNRNPYFLAFDDGVKQTNLRKGTVLSFPFLIPKETKEQQKIANCLSTADDLIQAQIVKIKSLKKHKRGIMQQLFLSVNELAI